MRSFNFNLRFQHPRSRCTALNKGRQEFGQAGALVLWLWEKTLVPGSWVLIPALYTGWTFIKLIFCKNFNEHLKKTENKWKRGRAFLKSISLAKPSSNEAASFEGSLRVSDQHCQPYFEKYKKTIKFQIYCLPKLCIVRRIHHKKLIFTVLKGQGTCDKWFFIIFHRYKFYTGNAFKAISG